MWAFVTDENKGGRGKTGTDVNRFTVTDFAKLGIAGLASKTSVVKYRKAWKRAIDAGFATDVGPGDRIDLPDVDWQAYFNPPAPKVEKPTKRLRVPLALSGCIGTRQR